MPVLAELIGNLVQKIEIDKFPKIIRKGVKTTLLFEVIHLLQLLENMVAREGAEAPTPAFSGPILTVIASTLLRPKFQMSSDSILLIR